MKKLLLAGASALAVLTGATGASAAILSTDVVFIVGKSGSMGGEQAFLLAVTDHINAGLIAAGVTKIDSSGTAFTADGAGGFTSGAGGVAVFSRGSTIADYVKSALATGGAAWGLNQLRAGGLIAFTNASIDIKVQEIVTPPSTDVPEPATLALLGVGLAGIGLTASARRRR